MSNLYDTNQWKTHFDSSDLAFAMLPARLLPTGGVKTADETLYTSVLLSLISNAHRD